MTTSVSTEQPGYTRSYLADQHAGQLARLQTLERAFDPLSHKVFERLDLPDAPAILDLGAGAEAQLEHLGVEVHRADPCTLTSTSLFSHRGDGPGAGRQIGLVWLAE